jgi:hypothetical protein
MLNWIYYMFFVIRKINRLEVLRISTIGVRQESELIFYYA